MNATVFVATAALAALLVAAAHNTHAVEATQHAWPSLVTLDTGDDAPSFVQEEQPVQDPDDDDRVPVQVWTVLAAGGAMALGLVLFMVRAVLGLVKPPPPPQESAEHH